MKKRVLSMLLAFILCFSTLPMTAFAQEADAVAEQENAEGRASKNSRKQTLRQSKRKQKQLRHRGKRLRLIRAPLRQLPVRKIPLRAKPPILWNPQWKVSAIVMPARRIPRQTMRRRQQCRRYRHSSMLCRTK